LTYSRNACSSAVQVSAVALPQCAAFGALNGMIYGLNGVPPLAIAATATGLSTGSHGEARDAPTTSHRYDTRMKLFHRSLADDDCTEHPSSLTFLSLAHCPGGQFRLRACPQAGRRQCDPPNEREGKRYRHWGSVVASEQCVGNTCGRRAAVEHRQGQQNHSGG
jgi:hypothetical protein